MTTTVLNTKFGEVETWILDHCKYNTTPIKMSLREYNFTANNINQKLSIIKQRSKMFYLIHLKSKFSASLSRSH